MKKQKKITKKSKHKQRIIKEEYIQKTKHLLVRYVTLGLKTNISNTDTKSVKCIQKANGIIC